MKTSYFIDLDNDNRYDTLNAVRWHVEDMSEEERASYDGMTVCREVPNDGSIAVRVIRVDKNGKVTLAKL